MSKDKKIKGELRKKEMPCRGCSKSVEVDMDTVSVLCWKCCSKNIPPYEKPKEKK
jgi:hypothetical protein